MEIYHSFWDLGYKKMDKELYDLHKLSVLSCLKSHKNIHLITTERGREFLQGLPYTSIELFEDQIDPFYAKFWAISKILAYKQILKKQKPFLHIDYDVFLFKKLPDTLLKSDIIVQSSENDEGHLEADLELPKFLHFCKNKHEFKNYKTDHSYNCGIFGGNNLSFIEKYCEEILKITYDTENKDLFDKAVFRHTVLLSSILEQFFLKILTVNNNINVGTLFGDKNFDKAVELGYTHLMVSKNSAEVIDAVRRKILTLENQQLEIDIK